MARAILLSAALSSVISILATALIVSLALPPMVAAQEGSIRAEQLVAVGPNGVDRARLFTARRSRNQMSEAFLSP